MKSRVLIAVPTRGTVRWQTASRLEAIRDTLPGCPPIMYQPGTASVALVRNTIVNTFLESDGDILVMVDDDVVPPLDILDHLLPIPDGYGVVAIPYPALQNTNFAFSVFDETPEGFRPKSWPYQDGWNQADAVGTGCVAIPRVALESLGKSPFRLEDDPRMKVIGEDFIFSSDLRKAGYKIGFWWDANIADHISTSSMIHFLEATTRHG